MTVSPIEIINRPEAIFDSGYAEHLDLLVSAELTPENIASFTADALNGLVGISEDMRLRQGLELGQWTRQAEDAAFNAFELGNIQEILKQITSVGDIINRAAAVAERIRVVDDVFVPSDQQAVSFNGNTSDNAFEKSTILRLQTVLFILEADFGVDTSDNETNNMEKGSTLKTMIRDDGYVHIDVPSLSRTILICDEAENASFVFDTSVIDQLQLTSKQLRMMSKNELANLIARCPTAGKRIIYSKDFTKDMKAAIASSGDGESMPLGTQYLLPAAGENIVSVNQMAKQLGIHANTLIKLAQAESILIGRYASPRGPVTGINNVHFEVFRQNEFVATPNAATYRALSVEELRRKVGLARETLVAICATNGIRVALYKFGNQPGAGVHGDDIDVLLGLPDLNVPDGEAKGAINTSKVLELLSPMQFVTLAEIKEELGLELEKYRFGSVTSQGYLKNDFEQVRQHEKACTPEAADYSAVSLAALAAQENTTPPTLKNRLKQANVRVGSFRFNNTLGEGVIGEDVDIAIAALGARLPAERRRGVSNEPKQYVSLNELRTRLDSTGHSVMAAAERVGITASDITVDGRPTTGFSNDEADLIWQEEKMATPSAEDYNAISFKPLETVLNVTRGQLKAGMAATGVQVGDFRFGPNYTRGILKSDIPQLKAYFVANNISR